MINNRTSAFPPVLKFELEYKGEITPLDSSPEGWTVTFGCNSETPFLGFKSLDTPPDFILRMRRSFR